MSDARWHRAPHLIREDGPDGVDVIVSGWIDPSGLFALDRPLAGHVDLWGVTHLPTGLALGDALPGFLTALRWLETVRALPINWRCLDIDEAMTAIEFGHPIARDYTNRAWSDSSRNRGFRIVEHRTRYVPRPPRRLRSRTCGDVPRVAATPGGAS